MRDYLVDQIGDPPERMFRLAGVADPSLLPDDVKHQIADNHNHTIAIEMNADREAGNGIGTKIDLRLAALSL